MKREISIELILPATGILTSLNNSNNFHKIIVEVNKYVPQESTQELVMLADQNQTCIPM